MRIRACSFNPLLVKDTKDSIPWSVRENTAETLRLSRYSGRYCSEVASMSQARACTSLRAAKTVKHLPPPTATKAPHRTLNHLACTHSTPCHLRCYNTFHDTAAASTAAETSSSSADLIVPALMGRAGLEPPCSEACWSYPPDASALCSPAPSSSSRIYAPAVKQPEPAPGDDAYKRRTQPHTAFLPISAAFCRPRVRISSFCVSGLDRGLHRLPNQAWPWTTEHELCRIEDKQPQCTSDIACSDKPAVTNCPPLNE